MPPAPCGPGCGLAAAAGDGAAAAVADTARVAELPSFDELVAEGESVPVAGWDFAWFNGRASEERPPWRYSRILAERMRRAQVALDVQTGGGEVLATVPHPPPRLVATESWPPNIHVAAANLRPLGVRLVAAAGPALPFRSAAFDLVVSRHPAISYEGYPGWWAEIARVLRPGGTFLAQMIGDGQQRELREALLGPQPAPLPRMGADVIAAAAEAAGLSVAELRLASLRSVFYDIAAVVYFLRKVIWIVPDFTVDRYRDQLARLHAHIQAEGCFISHAQRFCIEARRER